MVDLFDMFRSLERLLDPLISRILLTIIILLFGLVLGRVIGRVLDRIFKEIEFDPILRKTTGIKLKLGEVISAAVMYLIYFAFIVMALARLGIHTFVFNVILIGFAALLFFMLVLSIKDFIPNLIAGLFIHHKRFIRDGDYIKAGDVEGKIVHISLVETKIKTKSGDALLVPNSFLTKNKILKKK